MKKIIFMICVIVILAHVLYAEDYNTTCIGTAIYAGPGTEEIQGRYNKVYRPWDMVYL